MPNYQKNRRGEWVKIVGGPPRSEPDDVAEGHDEMLVAWCLALHPRRRADLAWELRPKVREPVITPEADRVMRPDIKDARMTPVLTELTDDDWLWVLTHMTSAHLQAHQQLVDRPDVRPQLDDGPLLYDQLQFWCKARGIPTSWTPLRARTDMVEYITTRMSPAIDRVERTVHDQLV